jgi:hypothetical protein
VVDAAILVGEFEVPAALALVGAAAGALALGGDVEGDSQLAGIGAEAGDPGGAGDAEVGLVLRPEVRRRCTGQRVAAAANRLKKILKNRPLMIEVV